MIKVMVLGVGRLGYDLVSELMTRKLPCVSYCYLDTDLQAIKASSVELVLHLANSTGVCASIKTLLKDVDLLLIVASLGERSSLLAVPQAAKAAYDLSILSIAVTTWPLFSESEYSWRVTSLVIKSLIRTVDCHIVTSLQDLLNGLDTNASQQEILELGQQHCLQAVLGVIEPLVLISFPTLDYADARQFFSGSILGVSGAGSAIGAEHATVATLAAVTQIRIALEGYLRLEDSRRFWVHIKVGLDLEIEEIDTVIKILSALIPSCENIAVACSMDVNIKDTFHVTLIASGLGGL